MRKIVIASMAAALLAAGCASKAANQPTPHTPAQAGAATPAATPSPSTAALTCTDLEGVIRPMVADLHKQRKLFAVIGTNLPQKTKTKMALGAWTPRGTYSHDLRRALNRINSWVSAHSAYGSAATGQGNIDPYIPSQPAQLVGDVYNFNANGTYAISDVATLSQFASLKSNIASLAADCSSG